VTGEIVADAIRARGAGATTTYVATLDDIPEVLERVHDESDVVVLLGAGDVASIATKLKGLR
jgi:UDP-N-acetylmuramate-alanine ligase